MNNFTSEEINFLLGLLKAPILQGTPEQMEKMLELRKSILAKLAQLTAQENKPTNQT